MADPLDGATQIQPTPTSTDPLAGATQIQAPPKPIIPSMTARQIKAARDLATKNPNPAAAEKEALQQPTVDPTFVAADAITGGLASMPEGIAAAIKAGARAAGSSAVFQKASDIVARKTGDVIGNHPYVQAAAGLAIPMILDVAARRYGRGVLPAQAAEGSTIAEGPEGTATIGGPAAGRPDAQPTGAAAVRQNILDAVTPTAPPAGAVAHAADPLEGAQEIAAPARATAPTGTPAETQPLDQGMPGASVFRIPRNRVELKPEVYQHKIGADDKGGGLALTDIRRFDLGKSGVLTVHHTGEYGTPSSKYFIVNGHQRLNAADRLGVTEPLRYQVLDAGNTHPGAVASNYTEAQARAYGATINLAEGRGTALDAAKFMRDSGVVNPIKMLEDEGISLTEKKAQDAVGLSQLSDRLFHETTIGRLPENRAAIIGRELGDNPAGQDHLMETLAKRREDGHPDLTDKQLTALIRDTKAAPTYTQTQTDLFGTREVERSLAPERAIILSHVDDELRDEKRAFGQANKNAERLRQGNTIVDKAQASAIQASAATRSALLTKFSRSGGATDAAVNHYAELLANSPKNAKSGILKDAYRDIYDALSQDHAATFNTDEPLAGTSPQGGPGQGNLLVGQPSATPSGATATEEPAAGPSAAELESAGQGNMFGGAQQPSPAVQEPAEPVAPTPGGNDVAAGEAPVSGNVAGAANVANPTVGEGHTDLGATPIPMLPEVAQALARTAVEAPGKIASSLKAGRDAWNYSFDPESLGPSATRMGQILREESGVYAARQYRTKALLESTRAELEKIPDIKARYRNFYTPIQRGEIDSLPVALRPVARVIRQMTDERWNIIDHITDGALAYRDNYLPHLFAESPERVREVFNALENTGARSLQASTKFFRRKIFDDMTEAIDRGGLTPKYDNPIDMIMAGLRNEDRYILGQTVFQKGKDAGLIKFYRPGAAPEGMAKIDDRIAQVKSYSATEKGMVERGEWRAPEDAALVINRFLAPGLKNQKGIAGGLARINDKYVSEMNAFRVSFSAFHFLFESINHAAEGVGMGVFKGLGALLSGDLREAGTGLKEAATAMTPIETWRAYRVGGQIQRALLQPGTQGEAFDRAVQWTIKGGGRFGRETAAFTDGMEAALKDIHRDALSAPLKAVHALSKPLMDYFVPRMKLGANFMLAKREVARAMERSGGELPEVELRAILQGTWDHVDGVFGQMTRDNQFMSNSMKDVMKLGMAFPGWQIGSFKVAGRAITGTGRAALGGSLRQSERLALQYGTGLLIMHAMVNSVLNYALTGEAPKSIHDLMQARDGGRDQYGNPTRINIPDYMRTFISAAKHPLRWAENIVSLPLQWANEAINNRDYFGNQVVNPQDPLPVQIGQYAQHSAKDLLPFSFQNVTEASKEPGVGSLRKALSYAGISPTAREFRQTPAQNLMDSMVQHEAQSPEVAAHAKLVSDLRDHAKAHDVSADLRNGKFSIDELHMAMRDAALPPFQGRLSGLMPTHGNSALVVQGFQNAFRIYDAANPTEKAQAFPIMIKKLNEAIKRGALPREAVPGIIQQFRKIDAERKAAPAAVGMGE